MPVAQIALVRNHNPGPTCLTVEGPPRVQLEWKGSGDPNGEDLQEVPENILMDLNFRRVMSKGVLTVEEASPEVLEQLEALDARMRSRGDRWKAKQVSESATALEALEPGADNDIVGIPCIGPASRGSGTCGDSVAVRENELKNRPPLCEIHAHLQHQFIFSETGELKDGKPVGVWTRGTMSSKPMPSQAEAS